MITHKERMAQDCAALESDVRPMTASTRNEHAHCYDGEKCNSDTFCECPCLRCMAMKRGGDYQTR